MKEAAPKAQDIAKPYQPTQADVQAFETYMAARKKAAPRLKVVPNAQGAEQVSIDHPDKVLGQLVLMKGLGTVQVEALKNYRSKGEQKMTVQHVHVAEGGQAIVGNVSAPALGAGGQGKKRRNNPMHWPMHRALRCRAKSKRSGLQCRAPAVRGSVGSAACTGPLAALLEATGTP
jgi:hypothetical protein